ncbi:MAG: sigma-54-dependent Fis family transcriptional regulator [Rhodocyclaceae bacterium]|jgi:two-component system response regulator FlrC|nr:sigma-54-dependent Fis family transcriptional regulator [Rhodocyclaceae bacterium]
MPEPLNILVVEDDLQLRDAVCLTLECAGHHVLGAADGPAALHLLERQAFNLVVSDLRMQPMDGIELLRAIRGREPHLPVLLMTAFGDVDKAVSAMRAGACDFLLKPFEPKVLLEHVERHAAQPAQAEGVIAADPRTKNLLALAARVAKTDATVLLTGESGTGKEVFARCMHGQSPRHGAPFVAINCAAIPENLLEATLFGHEKGSFTGAQAAQAGKFEQAQGGTLLLDEISEMPLGLQAKLLRVLQEREVERVGGRKPIPLDIRVLATSNRDMAKEVAAGRFREDLYYRLNVFPLQIPALRERPADIVPLARHFAALHGSPAARFAADAEALLTAHGWPGNVRELENAVQRALILAGGDTIAAEHLQLSLQFSAPAKMPQLPVAQEEIRPLERPQAMPSSMRDLERQHILETLAAVNGSRKRAVELLGISERTLRYKLQQYRTAGAI